MNYRLSVLFGVPESTFLRSTKIVIDCIVANVHKFIAWPRKEELPQYAAEFTNVGRFFPNVIGKGTFNSNQTLTLKFYNI